jgi:hypothetical protein
MLSAMRWMRWALVVCACAALLGASSAALAKTIIINPPGSAGANEYSEVIPSSAGNVAPPSGGSGSGKSASGITRLGQGRVGVARLQHLGGDGRSAAAFAASSAPTPAQSVHGGAGSPAASPNGSASAGIANALTGSDSGGLGSLLPLLLATVLVAAIGIVVADLRRRAQPRPPGA